MASCCSKILENPTIGREKELREKITHLLGTIVKQYNQTLSKLNILMRKKCLLSALFLPPSGVSLKIIQLLQHFEHLVSPLAQLVANIAATFEARNMVAEVIR